MKTYYFDIASDTVVTRELLKADDEAAAVRQAVLLLSEILRDHALAARGDIELRIQVQDADGQVVWNGASSLRRR